MVVSLGSKTVYIKVVAPECTRADFRDGMLNAFRSIAVDWVNSYSPVVDVTQKAKNVYPDVLKAFLAIYGDNLDAIRVQGPYDYQPSPLPDDQVIFNWRACGEEWERQRCPRNNKYYWVVYPAKFIAFKDISVSLGTSSVTKGKPLPIAVKIPYLLTENKTATLIVTASPDWGSPVSKSQKVTGTGTWTEASADLEIDTSGATVGDHSVAVTVKVDLG